MPKLILLRTLIWERNYLICYSETLGDRAYRCPPRTTEGRRNELHEYLHCTI